MSLLAPRQYDLLCAHVHHTAVHGLPIESAISLKPLARSIFSPATVAKALCLGNQNRDACLRHLHPSDVYALTSEGIRLIQDVRDIPHTGITRRLGAAVHDYTAEDLVPVEELRSLPYVTTEPGLVDVRHPLVGHLLLQRILSNLTEREELRTFPARAFHPPIALYYKDGELVFHVTGRSLGEMAAQVLIEFNRMGS